MKHLSERYEIVHDELHTASKVTVSPNSIKPEVLPAMAFYLVLKRSLGENLLRDKSKTT